MNQHLNNPSDIQQLIQLLEHRQLDSMSPSSQAIWGAKIETIPYYRISGQPNFWDPGQGFEQQGYEERMDDVITGLHQVCLSQPSGAFAYLILSSAAGFEIYSGVKGNGLDQILLSSLRGNFPGVLISSQADTRLGSQRKPSGLYENLGRMSGIPTRKTGSRMDYGNGEIPKNNMTRQVERLLRSLAGEEWGYLVWAVPVQDKDIVTALYDRLSEQTQLSMRIHSQENYQATETENLSPTKSKTESRSRSFDSTDRWAEYAAELMEIDLKRLEVGKSQGMWRTDVYYFASNPVILSKIRSLLRATFAGDASRPEPVRTFICERGQPVPNSDPFTSMLTSQEVSTLCQLPRDEIPGFRITDYARFHVDVPAPSKDPIAIGKLLDGGQPLGGWFSLPRSDFAKHGLIVGVTGSGKTNTVFYLLDKLWNHGQGIPFMVIEPAKTEYRDLLKRQGLGDKLQVFTLGDERVSPFRINPFAFEIAGVDNRVHVQTHIDFLKSVFNAAFILYAPMPYVLETCLHEIYQDKGWDLTTGQNRRLPLHERGHEDRWPIFPTLSDLYNKINEVVDRLGYEERIEMDVKAGLKARIGSLRLGGKGLMLDTRFGMSMTDLLSKPTILELEGIGNDDEKAFLIGLILTRLYEYRIVQARSGTSTSVLKHVMVFEEAHRLLKNVHTEVGTEESNTKGQAVETFSNMLSEIRAYGQGVLIAEQIPTKLAPDAIKNTNLKIMHRVVSLDDRHAMGATMNLDESQTRIVATLDAGQAAVFAEGMQGASLVKIVQQIEKDPKKPTSRVSDVDVANSILIYKSTHIYEPIAGAHKYIKLDPEKLTYAHDIAKEVLDHSEFPEQLARYFLSTVLDARQAINGFNGLMEFMRRAANNLPPAMEKTVATLVILYALEDLFEIRGRHYRWLYNIGETLRSQLADIFADIAAKYQNKGDQLDQLFAIHQNQLQSFSDAYRDRTDFKKRPGPYIGCITCDARCLYRWDVATLLKDKALERDFIQSVNNAPNDQAMWRRMTDVAHKASGRLMSASHEGANDGVAICFVAQITAKLNLSGSSQKKASQNLKTLLKKKQLNKEQKS